MKNGRSKVHFLLSQLFGSNLTLRFIAEGVTRGTSFLLIPLLSWNLGAAQFGAYSQITSLSFAFVPLISAGLGFTVVRRLAGSRQDRGSLLLLFRAVAIVSALSIVSFMLLWLGGLEVFSLLNIDAIMLPNGKWAYLIAILAWATAVEALTMEYCRAFRQVKRSVLAQICSGTFLLSALCILYALDSLSLQFVLATIIATRLTISVSIFALIISDLRAEVENCHRAHRKSIPLLLGVPYMLSGFAEWGGNFADRLIVGKGLGSIAVAEYAAALMLLSLLVAVGGPIWWFLLPTMASALNEGKRSESQNLYYSGIYTEIALPLWGFLILIGDPVLSLVLNHPVSNMRAVMLVAGAAILINQLTTGLEYYVVCKSGGKRLLAMTVCSIGIGLALSVVLVEELGLLGVATGVFIGKLVLSVIVSCVAVQNGHRGVPWRIDQVILVLGIAGSAGYSVAQLNVAWWSKGAIYVLLYSAARFGAQKIRLL